MEHQGQCHCGSVKFTFKAPEITGGVRCNCSYCTRRGAVMSDFAIAPEDIQWQVEGDALALYQFRSKEARHHFCRQCGIYTFHQTISVPGHYRVNLACVDGVPVYELPISIVNGAAL